MGVGSHAIAEVNPDNRAEVFVYCVTPDGSVPSATQLGLLSAAATAVCPMGMVVTAKEMALTNLTMRAIVKLENYADPMVTFTKFRTKIENFFKPGNWGDGTVRYKELEHLARDIEGVRYVQGVYVFVSTESPAALVPSYLLEARDIPLGNSHTLPVLTFVGLDMVTDFTTYSYEYSPLPFVPERLP